MLDAAAELLVDAGPGALTAAGVARRLGAPSGSLYHRFGSRDHLAAALWLRSVERFDADVVQGLWSTDDPLVVAVRTARDVVGWTAAHPVDAAILTLFRREDLTGAGTPADLAQRAERLGRQQAEAVEHLSTRLARPVEIVRFAVAGIPLAAVRPFVDERRAIAAWVGDAVERAVRGVLGRSTARSTP